MSDIPHNLQTTAPPRLRRRVARCGGIEFSNLDKLDIVGIFPNYASAYAAWKAKAQGTVDNAVRISSYICTGYSTGGEAQR